MKRRKPGRPPRDYSDDRDVVIAELAVALQTLGLSERVAFDFAIATTEAAIDRPSKRPRGAKVGLAVGYVLPSGKGGFPGRSRDIRRKLKRGKLRPNAERVLALVRLLHRKGGDG